MQRPSWYLDCNSDDWRRARMQALVRDNFRCTQCGQADLQELQVHHKKARITGGRHNLENLVTLCWECHATIHPHMRKEKVQKCREFDLPQREL